MPGNKSCSAFLGNCFQIPAACVPFGHTAASEITPLSAKTPACLRGRKSSGSIGRSPIKVRAALPWAQIWSSCKFFSFFRRLGDNRLPRPSCQLSTHPRPAVWNWACAHLPERRAVCRCEGWHPPATRIYAHHFCVCRRLWIWRLFCHLGSHLQWPE